MAAIAHCYEMQELSPCLMLNISVQERQVIRFTWDEENEGSNPSTETILGSSQVGKALDFGSSISQVRVLPPQPNFQAEWQKWHLVGLISRRIQVRVLSPQPIMGLQLSWESACLAHRRSRVQLSSVPPFAFLTQWSECLFDIQKVAGSNPAESTKIKFIYLCGHNSIGRVSAFQAECCEFDSRCSLHKILCLQLRRTEQQPPKLQVRSSNLFKHARWIRTSVGQRVWLITASSLVRLQADPPNFKTEWQTLWT